MPRSALITSITGAGWSRRLIFGAVLAVILAAVTSSGLAQDGPPASPLSHLPAKNQNLKLPTKSTRLEWEAVPDSAAYEVELTLKTDESREVVRTKKAELQRHLRIGNYSMRVRSLDGRLVAGPWSEAVEFWVAAPPPKMQNPINKQLFTITAGDAMKRTFKWQTWPGFLDYQWFLKKPNQDVNTETSRESQLTLEFDEPGTYQFWVTTVTPGQSETTAAKVQAPTEAQQFTIIVKEPPPQREDLKLDPFPYFSLLSYYVGYVDYGFENAEAADSNFSTVVGTGRVGLGYISPTNRKGVAGIVDLSGFNLDGSTYIFPSAEVHYLWTRDFGSKSITLSSGLYGKDLPTLAGSAADGLDSVGTIRSFGPHVGADLYLKWTQKIGLQLQSRLYYSVYGSAPNGRDIVPQPSWLISGQLVNRFHRRVRGLVGAAYKLDRAAYEALTVDSDGQATFAESGDINVVSIEGAYLSLMLEIEF